MRIIKKITAITTVTIALLLIAPCVNAIDSLKFNKASPSPSIDLKLKKFFEENSDIENSKYEMYETDLNNDGLLEYILKLHGDENVTTLPSYKYLVFAETDKKVVLLSQINAFNVMISDETTFGIKNLLVFQNKINEYSYDIYVWSPHKKMYIMDKAKEIRK